MSNGANVIGTILREMHAQRDMQHWAPFLLAINATHRGKSGFESAGYMSNIRG
jgi:hypothetical protein